VQLIMKSIQTGVRDRMLLKIEKDPLVDENTLEDNNSIDILMNIKYFLETFKLILVIFNVSYFTGIIWIIFCDFMERYFFSHEVDET
jgi:hypothetical protein